MKVIWGGGNPTIQQLATSSSPVYFYKGNIVSESAIDFTNDDLCDAYGFIANDDKHYIFDNETELLAWGSNLPSVTDRDKLVNLITDRQAIEAIAVSTNAVAYADANNGDAPQSYIDQANAYWLKKYGTKATSRGFGAIYDLCGGRGALYPISPGIVFYYPDNARNKMSYVEEIGVVGTTFCTKSFLRGKKFYFNPVYFVFGFCFTNTFMDNNQVSSITIF